MWYANRYIARVAHFFKGGTMWLTSIHFLPAIDKSDPYIILHIIPFDQGTMLSIIYAILLPWYGCKISCT